MTKARQVTLIPRLVEEGRLSVELIDKAVSRILRVKFLAGLFENPYGDAGSAKNTMNCSMHKALALKAARESIVLLRNNGGILPLDKKLKRIAVIGPNADRIQLGGYSIEKREALTLHQAIRNKVSPDTEVLYARGCGLYELERDGFDEAINLASRSDVAIVALGTCSKVKCEKGWTESLNTAETCGENYDTADLDLTGLQQELAEKIIATGTPTVIVLINGRPISTRWLSENAPAILEAWYPGEEGGSAIADILFGDVNPSGKLTISSNLVITPEKIKPYENTAVKVTVKNTGSREGKEVVQLYIQDTISSVTTPVKSLKGFRKVFLEPGEQKCVEFLLTPGDLSLIDENMQSIVEPGSFKVMIGDLSGYFDVVP